MRNSTYFLLLSSFSGYCYGQQDPLYAQYLTNLMIFNPAYDRAEQCI